MNATFHLALPCDSIEEVREFYVNILGARQGRSTEKWIDIDLYGNQLTFTNTGPFNFSFKNYKLSGQILPAFHFGVIVDIDTWGSLLGTLSKKDIDITTEVAFLEEKIGEHLSFFVTDPNGYTLEFKSFKKAGEIFQKD